MPVYTSSSLSLSMRLSSQSVISESISELVRQLVFQGVSHQYITLNNIVFVSVSICRRLCQCVNKSVQYSMNPCVCMQVIEGVSTSVHPVVRQYFCSRFCPIIARFGADNSGRPNPGKSRWHTHWWDYMSIKVWLV